MGQSAFLRFTVSTVGVLFKLTATFLHYVNAFASCRDCVASQGMVGFFKKP